MRLVALTLALAASVMLRPHVAAAGASWDDTLKAANQEGEVDVHGGPGKLFEQVLTEGFRRAYPQIKLNYSGLGGRDAIPKIMREREAGIYNWDIYIGGTFSILENLKPAHALAPLRPALALPEVLDDSAWYGGLDSGWMDNQKNLVLAFEALVTPTALVNWDFVKRDDLKTYQDLLKPQFAGKIVWDDPRLPGQGSAAAERLVLNFGAGFLKRLFTEQKIVYITNSRQNAEWVVRGTYPIGIATAVDQLEPFRQQGLGQHIESLDAPLEHPTLAPGFGSLALIDHAPHPEAAKVYINWLLSRSGQTDWGKMGHNSRRLDVPHAMPEYFPKPGIAYVAEQTEANIAGRQEAADLAKKFIPSQP